MLQARTPTIWAAEVGGPCPDIAEFGCLTDGNGDASFRRLIQIMTPHIREKSSPGPKAAPKPADCDQGKMFRCTLTAPSGLQSTVWIRHADLAISKGAMRRVRKELAIAFDGLAQLQPPHDRFTLNPQPDGSCVLVDAQNA